MLHIESAKYYGDYKIKVHFNDGSTHIVDLEHTIFNDNRPIIKALSNKKLFQDFSIQLHTITWTNGLDFAPEFIKSCSIQSIKETA